MPEPCQLIRAGQAARPGTDDRDRRALAPRRQCLPEPVSEGEFVHEPFNSANRHRFRSRI
jgi:hypothetical protein